MDVKINSHPLDKQCQCHQESVIGFNLKVKLYCACDQQNESSPDKDYFFNLTDVFYNPNGSYHHTHILRSYLSFKFCKAGI